MYTVIPNMFRYQDNLVHSIYPFYYQFILVVKYEKKAFINDAFQNACVIIIGSDDNAVVNIEKRHG